MSRRLLLAVLCALALPGGAAGCRPAVKTKALALYAAPRANDGSAVAVEMVVVYDEELLKVVAELTARQWFQQRERLREDHPGGLRSLSWELVPGQSIPLQPLRYPRRKARGAFVFADYYAPGDHRVRIDPHGKVLVTLKEEGFSIDPT